MKNSRAAARFQRGWLVFWLTLLGAGFLFAIPAANARTITLSLQLGRLQYSVLDAYAGSTYYTVNVLVYSDIPPVTYDEIDSPGSLYGGNENGYGDYYFNDVDSAVNSATNGVWTLTVNKGDASEKQYTFKISAGGLSNANFPAVQITTPVDGATGVSTTTAFDWSGPSTWDSLSLLDHNQDYSFYAPDQPTPDTTSWIDAGVLPLATNEFEVTYTTNASPWFTISTPVDNQSHPFTNWVAGAVLFVFDQSGFVTGTNTGGVGPGPVYDGHALVAHYAFDDNTIYTADVSGSGNNITGSTGNGGASTIYITNDAAAGPYAAYFYAPQNPDYTYSASWLLPATNLLATFAGSFTASLWLKTSDVFSGDTYPAGDGEGILTEDYTLNFIANNNAYSAPDQVVPMALTGHKLAFLTGDIYGGNDDTLHSQANIDTGNYVHLVVTRDQVTGAKKIYVNGLLDNSDIGSSATLNTPQQLKIGALQIVPVGGTVFSPDHGINGDLDDIQIYNGVLSSNEVAYLYSHPGTAVADVAGTLEDPLAVSLNAPQLVWTTNGNAGWFPETATNNDGYSAAQSGAIGAGQSSILQTIVTNGVSGCALSFTWQTVAVDTNFTLSFYVDGQLRGQLFNSTVWTGFGLYRIGPGTHTLQWVAAVDNGGTALSLDDAGWVDQVNLTPVPVVGAVVSPNVGHGPLTVQFTAPAADTLGNAVTSWNWNFGDGQTGTTQNPSHTYTNVGTYFPTLTTVDAIGVTPITLGPSSVTLTFLEESNIVKNLPGSPAGFTFHNFANSKSLQFLGSATNVTTSDGSVLELTPSAGGQAGAAFTAVPLPFGPNVGFSTFFKFRLSKPGGLTDSDGVEGADGIAFLIQSAGYTYGTGGGGIGYNGISNSLAVEFDTWNNATQYGSPGDINGNHVAVNINGVLNDPVSVPIADPMNNGNVWYAWVDYEGVSKELEVRLSEVPVRPLAPTLDVNMDLTSILGGTNAFVGFTGSTGAGWNEQDVLSWKFTALPTTRFTGTFNLTNAPYGLQINHGIVLVRHRYFVAGVTYTNFSYVPFDTISNANAKFAFATKLAELAPEDNFIVANPDSVDIALSNNAAVLDDVDFMDFAMLAAYTNSDSDSVGAAINYNNPDYIPFAPYYANLGFTVFNMDEPTYNTLQDQVAANPPAAFNPPSQLTQLQIDASTFNGPNNGQWISLDTGGVIQGNTITYSLATDAGTMNARWQVVYSPPVSLLISSPRSDGTNFVFNFGTVSNQSYTVWDNLNLATTNWVATTNVLGDGYVQQITVPVTNSTKSFYRLSSP
jgi:hypothetical protein